MVENENVNDAVGASDVVSKQAVVVDIDTTLHVVVVVVDNTLNVAMDALDNDYYLHANVEHIDKLHQMNVDTWVDVDDDDDGEELVAASDMALNVLLLLSFVADQDDSQPSDQTI